MISAIFLRETLEAANNDAEILVQERLRKKATYVRKLESDSTSELENGELHAHIACILSQIRHTQTSLPFA